MSSRGCVQWLPESREIFLIHFGHPQIHTFLGKMASSSQQRFFPFVRLFAALYIWMMKEKLSTRTIFWFWFPLASTWLMMAVEGPLVTAIIARLPEAKFNLAAFGVSFAFAMIVESPIIMIMSASTALVKSRPSLQRLFRFNLFLNITITAVILILVITPLFDLIIRNLIGLPEEVSRLCHRSFIAFIPWPAAIGFRRFYQGILINHFQTRKVAYGTVIRVLSVVTGAFFLRWSSWFPGAVVGAAALSFGVVMEALATRWMVRESLQKVKMVEDYLPDEQPMNYRELWKFYYPLALTSILSLSVHPFVTFFLGQSRLAIESLAVLPVVNGLVFLFRSIGLSYQEVVIAMIGRKLEHRREVFQFGLRLFVGVLMVLGVVAFTPLSDFWYESVAGLSPALTSLAISSTKILIILPSLTVLLSVQRALLVVANHTGPVSIATTIELAGIIAMLFMLTAGLDMIGIYAAAIAFLVGRLMANIYLMIPLRLVLRQS